MTAVQSPPPSGASRPVSTTAQTTARPTATAGAGTPGRAPRSTPARYRRWSVALTGLLAVTAMVSWLSATALRTTTSRIRTNSGPVLVATQELVASLAEADAAASAVYLSGRDEDREQRRLYEQALGRAGEQLEEISSLVGDDEASHDTVKSLSVLLIRYAGLVEASRANVRSGAAGAEQPLLEALDLLSGAIDRYVASLTESTEARLDRDERDRLGAAGFAIGLCAISTIALVVVQLALFRRTRRVLNVPLLLATVAVVAAGAWLGRAGSTTGERITDARRLGFDSIRLTSRIQRTAFASKAQETVALIAEDAARQVRAEQEALKVSGTAITDEDVTQARSGVATGSGLFAEAVRAADSPGEQAAVAEMLVRWQRYRNAVTDLRGAPPAAARAQMVGPASSAFNGFNFSVESVLRDNRDQFLDGVGGAARTARPVPVAAALLPLLAAVAALAGLQQRINEYR